MTAAGQTDRSPEGGAPLNQMPTSARPSLRLGVVVPARQRRTAEEFFQLFKTPWAFCEGRAPEEFGATLATVPMPSLPDAGLTLAFGPDGGAIDRILNLQNIPLPRGRGASYRGMRLPLHADCAAFEGEGEPIGPTDDAGRSIGRVVHRAGRTVVRVGYDLFDEVEHLLSTGLAADEAMSPAVEIHLSIIRDILLAQGIPVVEIPPCPHQHSFIACLTHDIDFIGIRHHWFDRSFWGFVYRALRSFIAVGGRDWRAIRRNLAALLSLPGVYLRWLPDFWYPLDRYAEVEGSLPSTYFFVPFAGRAGKSPSNGDAPRPRGVHYDVHEYAEDLRRLEGRSTEVGVHGIDAWTDASAAREELETIRRITGRRELGVRMHWLYYSKDSAKVLEEAGYSYDSTLGFNDAVGYRNGTAQVFRPSSASTLLELPLHIQDTALLYPRRMNLSTAAAASLCGALIRNAQRFGGVLTINWHDRSLAPERNWDRLYVDLIRDLTDAGAWFARAEQAVSWFRRRRAVEFSRVELQDDRLVVELANTGPVAGGRADDLPPLFVRVLPPSSTTPGAPGTPASAFEVPIDGPRALTFSIAR